MAARMKNSTAMNRNQSVHRRIKETIEKSEKDKHVQNIQMIMDIDKTIARRDNNEKESSARSGN